MTHTIYPEAAVRAIADTSRYLNTTNERDLDARCALDAMRVLPLEQRVEIGVWLMAVRDRHKSAGTSDQLSAKQAAALYNWAIGDGSRQLPTDDDSRGVVGCALRVLIETAGEELDWREVESLG